MAFIRFSETPDLWIGSTSVTIEPRWGPERLVMTLTSLSLWPACGPGEASVRFAQTPLCVLAQGRRTCGPLHSAPSAVVGSRAVAYG